MTSNVLYHSGIITVYNNKFNNSKELIEKIWNVLDTKLYISEVIGYSDDLIITHYIYVLKCHTHSTHKYVQLLCVKWKRNLKELSPTYDDFTYILALWWHKVEVHYVETLHLLNFDFFSRLAMCTGTVSYNAE